MKAKSHDNSIALYSPAHQEAKDKKAFLRKLPSAVLCAAGLGWMGRAVFPSAVDSAPLAAACLLVFALIFNGLKEKRFSRWIFPLVMGILTAAALIFLSPLRDGFCLLGNDILTAFMKNRGHIYLFREIQNAANGTGAALFLGIFLELLLSTGRLPALLLMILCALGSVLGFIPISMGEALFMAGALLVFFGGRESREIRYAALSLFPAILLGALALFLLGSQSSTLQESLSRSLHELAYDKSTNSMPEGKFKNLGGWTKNDTPALSVVMEEPEKLYLRGMTGEIYTGSSWEKIDGEAKYAWKDSFYYLHKDGFNALAAIASAQKITCETAEKTMSIQNLSACREHAYLPYALFSWEGLDESLIGDEEAPGSQTETLTYLTGSVPEWFEAQALLSDKQEEESAQTFLQMEEIYRSYVRENDLEIPADTASLLSRTLKVSDQEKTLSEIKDIILETLDQQLTYSEEAVTDSGDGDFLTYVLERSGKGYSVHYATAATLMLRYFGVPARYVEGYFLSGEAATHYKAGETITLTEENAHAWTEYYLDGVGWIPFETTPGYRDDEEINAGAGNEDGGRKYASPQTTKTPETDKRDEEQRETEENGGMIQHFAPSLKILVLVLLLLALLVLLLWILRGRRKLKKALQAIERADNREAIAALYGYGAALLGTAGIDDKNLPGAEEAAALNREALFSHHEMSEEERQKMKSYVEAALLESRKRWHVFQRLFYRLIKPLY